MYTTNKTTEKQVSIPQTPLGFIWHVSKPFKLWVVLSILTVVMGAVIAQSLPLFYKWIIEAVEVGDVDRALWLGLLYPAVIFLESVIWRLSGVLGMQWTVSAKKQANDELIAYSLAHSHTYFSNRFAGSLLNKVGNVIGAVEGFVHDFLWTILGVIVSVVVTLVYLFAVDTTSGYLFLVLIAILLVVNRLLMPKKRVLSLKAAAVSSKLRGQIVDVFGNSGVMRQFTAADYETKRITDVSAEWRDTTRIGWLYSEATQFLNGFILFLFLGAMMYFLVQDWGQGLVTTAEFIFVMALVTSLVGRLIFIGRVMTTWARNMGEAEEGLNEILVAHEINDETGAVTLQVAAGKIDWHNVSFTYGNNTVFNNFNLTIKGEQRIGLVGSSGAGKTTFMSLLLRQHELNAGSIMIDDQDIHQVTQNSLRQAISVVAQEPALFHRSIRDNIAYGNEAATLDEVIAVAKKSQAHDFIMTLEHGYDTLVGERGIKLSGGQKQRIAIARAMLKDAPILILDEATSALDSESEVEIQRALHQLMVGKTVIAIAHRLSTLREMDRIIVLEAGKIIEDGTHESLKIAGGKYQTLWTHQAGGFLPERPL